MFIIKQSLVAYSLITFEILCGQNQKKISAMRYPIYFHIRKAKFMYLPFQRCVEFLKPSRIFINNFKVKNTTLFAFNDDRKWRANYWYLLFCILHIYVLSSIIWQSLIAQSLTIVEISRGQNHLKNISMIYLRYLNKRNICVSTFLKRWNWRQLKTSAWF